MTSDFVPVRAGTREGVVYFHAGQELWACRRCGVVAAGRERPTECPVCDIRAALAAALHPGGETNDN